MEITVNIATQQGREKSLRATLASLRSQCKTIRVWCNGFEPYLWLSDMGVQAVKGDDFGSAAKFKFVRPNEYYCTCDDDIHYPSNYIETIVAAQQSKGGCVSFHGRKLKGKGLNYYRGHTFYHCANDCPDADIDVPGTGVGCINTKEFTPDNIEREEWRNMDDVAIGYLLAVAGINVSLINHKAGWLVSLPNESGIFQQESKTPIRQNALADIIYDIRNKPPKVSIVIPYLKDRGYLSQAVDSVKNQLYDGEIELIMSQANKPVGYNFNRGIELATGKYIKWLCDDDYLPMSCIYDSVKGIGNKLMLTGGATNFFPNGRKVYAKAAKPMIDQMLVYNQIHGGGLLYHRDVFKMYGLFDESLRTGEEYEYNLRLLSCGVDFAVLDKSLYFYRRHDEQKSLGIHADQSWRAEVINQIKNKYR